MFRECSIHVETFHQTNAANASLSSDGEVGEQHNAGASTRARVCYQQTRIGRKCNQHPRIVNASRQPICWLVLGFDCSAF